MLFPGLASFFFWIKGIALIGANRAGVFLHLMPIFGAIMAIIIFDEKFNVITGETGAGKSIIINALKMISGERAKFDLIKTNEKKFFKDGEISFFAKGKIKGKYLLTIAYNSTKAKTPIFKTIDKDKYYTIYLDASNQKQDAISSKNFI